MNKSIDQYLLNVSCAVLCLRRHIDLILFASGCSIERVSLRIGNEKKKKRSEDVDEQLKLRDVRRKEESKHVRERERSERYAMSK